VFRLLDLVSRGIWQCVRAYVCIFFLSSVTAVIVVYIHIFYLASLVIGIIFFFLTCIVVGGH